MTKRCLLTLIVLTVPFTAFPSAVVPAIVATASGATRQVPGDHATIQAAIDAAEEGDVILVAPGTYRERIRLRPRLTLRSAGDQSSGDRGLKRAEATILDGGGDTGASPGVAMAEESVLDGFTVTNVGVYDERVWMRHYESQGEELGDEEGAAHAEGTISAIRIHGISCKVTHCIVHHNGDVGIAVIGEPGKATAPLVVENRVYRNLGGGIGIAEGATALVRDNTCEENLRAGIGCRASSPLIIRNLCLRNIRAGIGCREGATPILRENACLRNRRAGIGIRMEGTAPLIEANECAENGMAGIGCRDGATPVIRQNVCRDNALAGIGCRDGGAPLIVANECRGNAQAGIGVQGKSRALIVSNQLHDNQTVAIGIVGESTATIENNDLSREGGMPPLVAVKDGSSATVLNNRFSGGGVAGLLVQGQALIRGNSFVGRVNDSGQISGQAIWIWENSTVTIADNSMDQYRTAIHSVKSMVTITGNSVRRFQGTAILVKESKAPAHVHGNTAISADPRAKVLDLTGPQGIVERNEQRAN